MCTIIISIITGLITSFFAALFYEDFINGRAKKKDKNKYGHFESMNDKFDWVSYPIEEDVIKDVPMALNQIRYQGNSQLLFKWKDIGEGKQVIGEGHINWTNEFFGVLTFNATNWFDYRNVFYKTIEFKGKMQDAIFVNADDQKTKYVLLRDK
jgi:hypothetical protein